MYRGAYAHRGGVYWAPKNRKSCKGRDDRTEGSGVIKVMTSVLSHASFGRERARQVLWGRMKIE